MDEYEVVREGNKYLIFLDGEHVGYACCMCAPQCQEIIHGDHWRHDGTWKEKNEETFKEKLEKTWGS